MSTTHIAIKGVNKIFASADREVVALKDIHLEIPQGQFVCLLGPSGCGKSTLLNAIAGFSLPTSGSITADGKAVTGPGPDRGMVVQEYALFPWMTVEKNIAFGLEIKGTAAEKIHEIVSTLLGKLGLTDFRNRYPKDLSGGMRQRVAIARTLILRPRIILMDEPFGALDPATRLDMQDLLVRLWREVEATVLFVTHSVEEAVYLGDRVFVMATTPGRIAEEIRMPAASAPARQTQSEQWFHEKVQVLHQQIEQIEAAARQPAAFCQTDTQGAS